MWPLLVLQGGCLGRFGQTGNSKHTATPEQISIKAKILKEKIARSLGANSRCEGSLQGI